MLRSRYIDGILLDIPSVMDVLLSQLPVQGPLKCVLLSGSMAGNASDAISNVSIELQSSRADLDVNGSEMMQIGPLVNALREAGINLVVCQKVVHPSLVRALAAQRIFVIDRLSIVHMSAFQRMTGAHATASITPQSLSSCQFGSVGGLHLLQCGRKQYIHVSPHQHISDVHRGPVTTLIICSTNQYALDESMAVAAASIRLLQHQVLNPRLLGGAGCVEIYLERSMSAIMANEFATKYGLALDTKIISSCVDGVGRSFRNLFAALCQSKLNSHTAADSLLNEPLDSCRGWNPIGDCCVSNVFETGIVDSYAAKRAAIVSAFQCAIMLLRTTSIILTA